jgi:hypothetical protein
MLSEDEWIIGIFALEVGEDVKGLILIFVCDEPSKGISTMQTREAETYLGDSGRKGTTPQRTKMKRNWNANGNLQLTGPPKKEKP